jgi:hypothetical protein
MFNTLIVTVPVTEHASMLGPPLLVDMAYGHILVLEDYNKISMLLTSSPVPSWPTATSAKKGAAYYYTW